MSGSGLGVAATNTVGSATCWPFPSWTLELGHPPKTSVSPGVRWPSLLWVISIASGSHPQVTPSSGAQFHAHVTPAIPLSQCHEGSTSPRCPRHPPQSQGSRALQVCAGVCGERGVLWGGGAPGFPTAEASAPYAGAQLTGRWAQLPIGRPRALSLNFLQREREQEAGDGVCRPWSQVITPLPLSHHPGDPSTPFPQHQRLFCLDVESRVGRGPGAPCPTEEAAEAQLCSRWWDGGKQACLGPFPCLPNPKHWVQRSRGPRRAHPL